MTLLLEKNREYMLQKPAIVLVCIVCFMVLVNRTLFCTDIPIEHEDLNDNSILSRSNLLSTMGSPDDPGGRLSHLEVILPPAISALLAGIFIMEDVLFHIADAGDAEIWIKRGTLLSIHIPVYIVSPCTGFFISGISVGFLTAYELLRDQNVSFFRGFLLTGVLQAGLYSTYSSYKKNRTMAQPGIYNNRWREYTFAARVAGKLGPFGDVYKEWKPYTLKELIISPFIPENFLDPMVTLLPLAGIFSPLLMRSHESAPWTTGALYVGGLKTSPYTAIPLMLAFFFIESGIVSISEESHFRGFIYEEIGSTRGHLAAKVFDCLYFPGIHISQEVFLTDLDSLTIGRNFLSRVVLTFYLDTLYDRGGLPRSTAAHFWIDYSLLFMQWLMVSGEPQYHISSIMGLLPDIRIRIPLTY